MAHRDLLSDPHKIKVTDETAWWYEEPSGISIVVEPNGLRARIIAIPWNSIRAALKRLDK